MGRILVLDFYRGEKAMKKPTVFDVANYFLSLEKMTHKKLQKMCYYAQAWHLALLSQPLFGNKFEAWIHGPVCPELYQEYKSFGWEDIPKKKSPQNIPSKSLEILDAVYETYSPYSGDQLEMLTHTEEPWLKARKGLKEWEPSNDEIEENIMGEFYKKNYENAQAD